MDYTEKNKIQDANDILISYDQIIEEIWKQQNYFLSTIARKVNKHLCSSDRQFIEVHKFNTVPEIFYNALAVFQDKYYLPKKVDNYKSARKLMCRIIFIETMRYIEKYIDEKWYRNLRMGERNLGLKPPSYYYHKKYWTDNAEHINEKRRLNYSLNAEARKKKQEYQRQYALKKKLNP